MPEEYLVDLEGYQRQLDAINAEFDTKIGQLNYEISVLNGEITTIQGQISNWSSKVGQAQSKVNGLIGELNNIEAKISTVNKIRQLAWQCLGLIQSGAPKEQVYAVRDEILQLWPSIFEDRCPVDSDTILVIFAGCGVVRARCDSLLYSLNSERATLQSELASAQADLSYYNSQLSSAQDALESKTRLMYDKKLAKEAAEEERRGAIALWQAEYYAAQERKRIELDSIARDVLLGYPEMDAVTASGIAESAYAEALARGFTRVADALTIAMALAQEWYETHVFPHFTTKTIICSGCGATLELTMSDIAEHNRELNCPVCGVYAC